MRKPTNSQAKALQGLKNQTDVMTYLEGCYEDAKDTLVTMHDSETVKALQGEARVLKKLLEEITGSTQKSGKR